MIRVRPSGKRGHTELGWLDSHHTFSFGDYYDEQNMGFGALRVINDDRVRRGTGFGTHGHQDMEILSYVLEGELEHKDSLGTGSVIRPGDVQRMSAGTGVRHSEKNPSSQADAHFLQIWIVPEQRGLPPSYEQKAFSEAERRRELRLVASRDGREGSLTVHQDVNLRAGLIGEGERRTLPLPPGRRAWVQVARGALSLNGQSLEEGDAAEVSGETTLELQGKALSEVLVFDLV